MAAPVGASAAAAADALAHETLDQAIDLGHVSPGTQDQEQGSIGSGPEGAADVEWFSFTLDGPAQVTWELTRQQPDSSFNGVLSLFNNDPYDFNDLYDPDGHRLLDQVDGKADGGTATLDDLLGQGTYYLAVSGDGNFDFYPLLAGSGLPGSTGAFNLQLSVADAGLPSTTGPQVLTSDPAPGSVLSASPLAIRVEMSGPLDPSTIIAGQTVQLLYSPDGDFALDGQQVPLGSVNFSPAVEDTPPPGGEAEGTVLHYQGNNELQLFPASPLVEGYYEVVLDGQSVGGSVALADPDGNDLDADAANPQGQDVTIPFQVDGIEGRTGADATEDDTPATAQVLGDITSAGIVQVAGVIGDDPYVYAPNQVDMYQFTVSGTGNDSLVAEVFAGRIGSPLTPGVSLFRLDPDDGSLQFVAGDINSYNPTVSSDGLSTPLYTDSVLYASLTPGEYYLAVADGSNTPSPLEYQPPGTPGIFDPNQPGSAQNGWSTGPYVLNVLVQPAPTPPQVVSTSPAAGATLTQLPTQVVVTFDQPMNLAQLALQQYQVSSEDNISAVYLEGADGTQYPLRLDSYDAATDTATFDLLDALPDGNYQLHLSGAAGLTDLGGNPLVGNDPSGDYVVPFTVDAPPRGDGGNPLEWTDQEPNNYISDPQDIGVLFPNELAAGVTISRDPSQDLQDWADVYQFQVLLDRVYAVTLVGEQVPPGVTLSLTVTTPSGQIVDSSWGSAPVVGELLPGTYLLVVNGWDSSQAPDVSYQVSLAMITQDDNAPPLVSGPAPAVAIQLDSVVPPTTPTPTPPPVVTPPVTTPPVSDPPVTTPPVSDPPVTTPPVTTPPVTPVTDTPVASPPSTEAPPVGTPSGGTAPSSTAAAPAVLAIAIPPQPEAIPSFTGASPLSLVALASSSVGALTGAEESQASPTALVQNASAAQSSLATGLIIVSSSFPLLGPGEGVVAAPVGPEAVEGPMTDVESSPADTASTRSPEGEGLIPAPGDDLLEIRVLSPPLPSDPVAAAAAAPLPVSVVAGPTSEVPPVAVAGRSARSDEDPGRSDRGPGRAFILAFTGLALGAYTRCRTLVRRGVRRDEGRACARPALATRRPRQGVGIWRGDA
jgi:methionine-rich copper-binding protein CopC